MSHPVSNDAVWHALQASEVVARLDSDAEHGLTAPEARTRLESYGPNAIPDAPMRGRLPRAWAQFNNPLIIVLIVAGCITLLLRNYIDSMVIFAVVLINAAIGYIQEGKAESALAAVRAMLASRAVVLRDGTRHEIAASDLVPGDIVLLEPGDRIPADLRLLSTRNLNIDESALTGESVTSEKGNEPADQSAPVGDRKGSAFSGTLITSGHGRGVVVATGRHTEVGQIGALVGGAHSLATPLTRTLDQFARRITIVILAVSVLAFAYAATIGGRSILESFLAVVGLAVAAIPEGLPAIITIILAIGTRVMAKNRAIIRRLPAVETLGSVSVICSDKTGTLTCNEMTVVQVLLTDTVVNVSGVGYAPTGEFTEGSQELGDVVKTELDELCRAAMLCNDAVVRESSDGEWTIVGDPMEAALVTLGRKAGFDHDQVVAENPRQDEIPFDADLRYMATAHPLSAGQGFRVFVKGAPEQVLNLCADADHDAWHRRVEQVAANGERVLAFAVADFPDLELPLSTEDLTQRMTLLGMVGLLDPPREEVLAAINECRRAGIRVVMITGDHAATAAAIGEKLGLQSTSALTGGAIEQMNDDELSVAVNQHDVIARASPEHKMRLVSTLQDGGAYVAMTGDGVNDAPALKAADIGVAMGDRGTDAARDASDLVLTDDNFATIAHAVREGRIVFENIRKSLLFVLPTNGGQGGLILLALLIGITLPVSVPQILWINMVTTVTLALALAFEPGEKGVMDQKPRPRTDALITTGMMIRIAYVSVLIIGVTMIAFSWEISRGSDVQVARTAAVNALVVAELLYLFNVRRLRTSSFHVDTFIGNRAALVAVLLLVVFQAAFTYLPPVQGIFDTAPLDPMSWLVIAALAIAMFVIVGLEKQILLWRSHIKNGHPRLDT
jgi:magnesium-transporting ATPase (P-type)